MFNVSCFSLLLVLITNCFMIIPWCFFRSSQSPESSGQEYEEERGGGGGGPLSQTIVIIAH